MHARHMTTVALLFLTWCFVAPTLHAYRHSVLITASQTWTAPVGASNVSVTLWGGGGGSSTSHACGAGGGSGAAIIGRLTNSDAWGVPIDSVPWSFVVGAGGAGAPSTQATAGYGAIAANGGETVVVATAPNGTELFRAVAYGGGGAKSTGTAYARACQGGAGGGQASSASGPVPGGGVPSGGVDSNPVGPPTEGAMIGDVKAGGAGAGYGFVGGNHLDPFAFGADWNSPGRSWAGGHGGVHSLVCYTWGAAAGFNGEGGSRQDYIPKYPPSNSGSGGGSAVVCNPGAVNTRKYYDDSDGASGGILVEYDHPTAPTPVTPSRTPSPSATRSPTPSISPSPSAQPWSQLVTLVSPISGRQLTPQDDGSVASLWVGATYKEKWTVTRLSNGKYTFKGFNNRYLGANPGGWVRAEATAVGSWEQWDVLINNAGNQWTLKSTHGTYMGTTAAGVVYLNGDSTLYWTKTTV
ncbi:Fascin-like incomplete domain containing protein [Pandoravirus salinus]|uniref:Fascin-like incomplete domain containing protein n=1 Tax=Pandoravirus salinus TaxID=1349410 RepID=S4VWC9_9VIRU|nr:Fascin-like incomplete domain [Pandoravirus salinus]AGO84949.1 Fascin-like incomplete domain containing protein [Pandoravirus salinus]